MFVGGLPKSWLEQKWIRTDEDDDDDDAYGDGAMVRAWSRRYIWLMMMMMVEASLEPALLLMLMHGDDGELRATAIVACC